jgi:hypothetical protein
MLGIIRPCINQSIVLPNEFDTISSMPSPRDCSAYFLIVTAVLNR